MILFITCLLKEDIPTKIKIFANISVDSLLIHMKLNFSENFLEDLNALMPTLLRWKWATFDLLPAFFPVQLRGKSTGNTYFSRKKMLTC